MRLTEAQARAIQKLRNVGIEAGAVIDLGALFLANTPADNGARRALKHIAGEGRGFRRQGARGLWIVLPELYEALDAYLADRKARLSKYSKESED